MLVSALAKRVPDDKYIMRGGRGTVPEDEIARSAFTLFNSTGFLWVISEGGSKEIDEVGWILDYLVNKGAICCVAGDAAIEAARHFDEQKKKYIFEKYSCEYAVKNLIPLGSDSSVVFLQEATSHWTRTGVHISHYANFPEMADVNYKLLGAATIMWGRWTDRMYSMAAGLVRSGHQILCGPVSGFGLKRLFLGNHFDRSKWHVWDTATGRELEAEPGQEHMIFPVETKEELITCIWGIGQKPGSSVSLARVLTLTPYIENHEKYFGELPDDWPYFVTNAQDLPIRHKMRLLKILREEYGWETDGAYITKIRARDGNLYTTEDFAYKFTTHEARFFTKSPKFMTKVAKDLFRKEGKKI